MTQHWFFRSLFFCFATTHLAAQTPGADSSSTAIKSFWQTTEKSIVLLRNEQDILPMKNLGGQRFSSLVFGLPTANAFQETLLKYTTCLPLPAQTGPQDVILVAIDLAGYSPANPACLAFEQQLQSLILKAKVIVAAFGNPEIIARMQYLGQAAALVYAPSIDGTNQSLAAQLIFGGIGASGKLDKDIDGLFKRGDGLETPGGLRFRYVPPELAGMDSQRLEDSISSIVELGIVAHAYPGAQVLVAKDGQVVFHKAYGFHTYDSLQPLRTGDLYDFASVTKVTSCLPALMKFYGEGRFDLDAPLKQYLPFFKKSNKANVAYREYLAHQGRLRPSIVFWRRAQDEAGHWKRRTFKDRYSRRYPIRVTDSLFLFKKHKKQMFKGIRDLPLTDQPGYVYSDLSFILYPEIVRQFAQTDLDDYLKRTFYQPLGAVTLTYNPTLPLDEIVPTERDTFFRKKLVHGTVHDETAAMLGGVSGHAGLFGSANDLAKLFQMYLNGGEYGGERFIAEKAVEEFTRCQYCDTGNRRGLGFDKPLIEYDPKESYVAKSASPASFGHSGYTGTFVWADPQNNLLVVFMSNRVYPDRSSRGLYDLNIRPRLHQAVYDAVRE